MSDTFRLTCMQVHELTDDLLRLERYLERYTNYYREVFWADELRDCIKNMQNKLNEINTTIKNEH